MEDQPVNKSLPISGLVKPEGFLYHYTDQKGLIGIFESKNIWATHARYLNDSAEGKLFADVLLRAFRDLGEQQTSQVVHTMATKKLVTRLDDIISKLHMFVVSFSEKGDLLSQWRAYSGASGGYSIGFNRAYLRKICANLLLVRKDWFHQDNNPLKQCRYLDDDGKSGASHKSHIANKGSSELFAPESREKVNGNIQARSSLGRQSAEEIFSQLRDKAASIKHNGFSEEAEWRIALFLTENANPDIIRFRPGSSMPTPYLEIDLQPNAVRIGIERVIVGPCPNPKDAVRSVELLLQSKRIQGVDVLPSEIPFRNW